MNEMEKFTIFGLFLRNFHRRQKLHLSAERLPGQAPGEAHQKCVAVVLPHLSHDSPAGWCRVNHLLAQVVSVLVGLNYPVARMHHPPALPERYNPPLHFRAPPSPF